MKLSFRTRLLATLLLLAAVLSPVLAPSRVQADTYFPQTGQSIWGPFEAYWKSHGGLAQFGLPRTTVYPASATHDAQWFERALFTYNPKNPDPYKVELDLLGSKATADRRAEAPFQPAKASGSGRFFRETAHNLSGKFLEYWQRSGGLPVYGYPISEPFNERSQADGKTYLVQYFERNRFELHPEQAGTAFEVQLGLLGSELLDARTGPSAFANLGKPNFYPARGVSVPPGSVSEPPRTSTPGSVPSMPAAPDLPATTDKVLFQDSFSSLDLNSWKPSSLQASSDLIPGWRVRNGVLEQMNQTPSTEGEAAVLVLTSQQFDNFTLDVYFYATSGEPVGAVFRLGGADYYHLKLYGEVQNNAPKGELLLVTGSAGTLLASSRTWAGYTRGVWHRLTIQASGSNLSALVDGKTILQATNARLTRGSIGLYAYADDSARFDNFRVTVPSNTSYYHR